MGFSFMILKTFQQIHDYFKIKVQKLIMIDFGMHFIINS